MSNQSSAVLDMIGVSHFFSDIESLCTFELAAIDFFKDWSDFDISKLLHYVNEKDIPDILIEFSKFGQVYKEVTHYRVYPTSRQDQYQLELRKGRGSAMDITFQAPISKQRYLIGVHGKKR